MSKRGAETGEGGIEPGTQNADQAKGHRVLSDELRSPIDFNSGSINVLAVRQSLCTPVTLYASHCRPGLDLTATEPDRTGPAPLSKQKIDEAPKDYFSSIRNRLAIDSIGMLS